MNNAQLHNPDDIFIFYNISPQQDLWVEDWDIQGYFPKCTIK